MLQLTTWDRALSLAHVYATGKRVTPENQKMEKIKGAYKYDWQAQTPPPLLVEQARQRRLAKAATPVAEA